MLLLHYVKHDEKPERVKDLDMILPPKSRTSNRDYKDPETENSIKKFSASSTIAIILSNSVIPVYICLILVHIINYSLLSLTYPILLFCYVLMREVRPEKGFWKLLLLYTIVVLMLKALIRTDLGTEYFPDRGNIISKEYRLGLYKSETNFSVKYYLFDVLILFFTVSHIICLMLQGLYHRRETEIENVLEASERIINITISNERSTTKRRKSQDDSFLPRQDSIKRNIEEQEDMKFDDIFRSNMVSGKNNKLK